MAAPTYAVNPTHTHIYGHAERYTGSTANPLPNPANAIWIPVGSSATVHFDDVANGILFAPAAVDLFLPARVRRVQSSGNEFVLFW